MKATKISQVFYNRLVAVLQGRAPVYNQVAPEDTKAPFVTFEKAKHSISRTKPGGGMVSYQSECQFDVFVYASTYANAIEICDILTDNLSQIKQNLEGMDINYICVTSIEEATDGQIYVVSPSFTLKFSEEITINT